MNEILEKIQKDMDKNFDDEIRNILGISEAPKQTTSEDAISDFKGMIDKMTTLIMCNPKNKELLEKIKDKLPPMTKIFANSLLEDDKIYLITDEDMKKSMLECMRISEKKKKDRKETP